MLQVPDFQLKNRFHLDNPWWSLEVETGQNRPNAQQLIAKVPEYGGPRRAYFLSLFELIFSMRANRAIVLMGPRRVGKTYLLKQMAAHLITQGVNPKRIAYASLETPLYTGMPLEALLGRFKDILQANERERLYVFFDEIQYLPQWEVHLKVLVDSFPQHRFVASGSAAAALRMKSNESGAGRFTDFALPPLSFAEFLQFKGLEDALMPQDDEGVRSPNDIERLNTEFIAYLNYGGYPEAVLMPEIQNNLERFIRSDIIDKVLLRDLPSLYGISNIQELNRLFTVLAFNTGNEISLEAIGKESGVAKNTLIRYLEYLEAAFLIRCIYRADENAQRMKRNRTFKTYLTNPAMRAALFGPLTEDDPAFGHVVETAVFASLLELPDHGSYAYARWDKGEIDFVRLDSVTQKPYMLLEVKWSDRPDTLDNAVDTLRRYAPARLLVLTTKSSSELKDGVEIVPTAAYCYRVADGRHVLDGFVDVEGSGA
jgi:uncharacterized protein